MIDDVYGDACVVGTYNDVRVVGKPEAGGHEGVHDLKGNGGEWENACERSVGKNDICHVRGGSF